MKIFGMLEDASLEQLSSDPSANTQGRIYQNTTEGRIKIDDGVSKKALLRNDEKMVIGNDPAPANNVRIHAGPAGVIQDVKGDDVTLEGVSSVNIGQRTSRDENLTEGTLPSAGNPGRKAFLTDSKTIGLDDGTNWRHLLPEFSIDDPTAGGAITLAPVLSSSVRLIGSFSSIEMIPAGFSSQKVTLINRSGGDTVISNESGATAANRILTGTNANLVFKSNSALTLQYDVVTQRWQVIGQAAGAGAGGAGVPNSFVQTVVGTPGGTSYSVLVTDDVILADTTNGAVMLSIPSASSNLGKRFLFEKIGSSQNNLLTITATINGLSGSHDIWALNAPFEIISDGTSWNTVSEASGSVFLSGPSSYVLCAASSQVTNIPLETMSVASATKLDNILPKAGNRIFLRAQTNPEENGLYIMPATNISIAATASSNVDISTLANGTVINAHVCATGEKVSLRFQTVAAENGIYVVGATAGTSVRDTSQRDPSYTTFGTLKNLVMFFDWYNYAQPPAALSTAPTEFSSSHTGDLAFIRQSNDVLTSFASAAYTTTSRIYDVQIPANASVVTIEHCQFGGAGGGGATNLASPVTGGGGGAGSLPIKFSAKLTTPRPTIRVTIANGSVPGTGRTAANSTANSTISVQDLTSNLFNYSATGASGGGGGGATSGGGLGGGNGIGSPAGLSLIGGPTTISGGAAGSNGTASYLATGGATGTGGVIGGGGGGGAHLKFGGGSGGNGNNVANSLGYNGGNGTGYGSGGGGGGMTQSTGRPGRGGFGGPGFVKITWE